jgi:NAD(P)-dependent dehydrogenase (short-subunit alcohol dehydrogenase family)
MAGALAGRVALVLGVERPAGRAAAVALVEAGADVAVCTLSEDSAAEVEAQSTANEFWALGRQGAVFVTDGRETAVKEAIADAGATLGPVSIVAWNAGFTLPRDVFSGLRSDPAVIVLVSDEDGPAGAGLLAWTRELADAGLRANALVASRAVAELAGPTLKEHHPPEPLDLAQAVVYLGSDASAAIEGAMVVAAQ